MVRIDLSTWKGLRIKMLFVMLVVTFLSLMDVGLHIYSLALHWMTVSPMNFCP